MFAHFFLHFLANYTLTCEAQKGCYGRKPGAVSLAPWLAPAVQTRACPAVQRHTNHDRGGWRFSGVKLNTKLTNGLFLLFLRQCFFSEISRKIRAQFELFSAETARAHNDGMFGTVRHRRNCNIAQCARHCAALCGTVQK